MKKSLLAIAIIVAMAGTSCSKQNEQSLAQHQDSTIAPPACDTANMKYLTDVVPILSANCYSCHGNGQAQGGVSLGSYAGAKGVADFGILLKVINHDPGVPPMPASGGKLSQCDINKITDWVNRGAPNN